MSDHTCKVFQAAVMSIAVLTFVLALSHIASAETEKLHFGPLPNRELTFDFTPRPYKEVRLEEMARMWKGTNLEQYTVPLLGMLLTENGALSESVRGDNGYAIGLDQTHICLRGFLGKRYCGKDAEKKLAKDLEGTEWHDYLTSWRTQFRYFTVTVSGMVESGHTATSIIKSWNSLEKGRLAKVKKRETVVKVALGL